jgi:hypothetical protein
VLESFEIQVPQKLQEFFRIQLNGKLIGVTGYDNLRGACMALKESPIGSEVVQVEHRRQCAKNCFIGGVPERTSRPGHRKKPRIIPN